jgi:hypothetical protein
MTLPLLTEQQEDLLLHLHMEIATLHFRWKIFRQIFVIDPDNPDKTQARYDLMNALLPNFFEEVRDLMLDFALLHICRITDDRQTKVKGCIEENLVIGQLIEVIDPMKSPALATVASDLRNRLDDIKKKCQPIRDHRNKRISHQDMKALLLTTTVLPQVTIQMVEVAVRAIREFLDAFELAIWGSKTQFESVVSTDDGDTVIEVLKRAFAFNGMLVNDPEIYKKWIDEGRFAIA